MRVNGGNSMGLFKEFKDDLSSAVNELVPGGEEANTAENVDNLCKML